MRLAFASSCDDSLLFAPHLQERKLLAALAARAEAKDADAAVIAAGAAEEESYHLQMSAKHAATAAKLRAGFVQVCKNIVCGQAYCGRSLLR